MESSIEVKMISAPRKTTTHAYFGTSFSSDRGGGKREREVGGWYFALQCFSFNKYVRIINEAFSFILSYFIYTRSHQPIELWKKFVILLLTTSKIT